MSDRELYRCKASLTTGEVISYDAAGQPSISPVWADQTKGKLRVTESALVFKNLFLKPIEIPYGTIRGALLLSTKLMFVRFHVLWVVHSDGSYGLAFRKNEFWDGQLPFRVVRENASTRTSDLVKDFARRVATGLVGEAAGGLVDGASLAAEVGGQLLGEGASEAADAAIDVATERMGQGQESRAASDAPRFVIHRGTKKSRVLTRRELITRAKNGKLNPNDQITDITKPGRVVRGKALIAKYG